MEWSATPGNKSPIKKALKGRNNHLTTPFALSGLGFFARLPRALPWAISFGPFRAIAINAFTCQCQQVWANPKNQWYTRIICSDLSNTAGTSRRRCFTMTTPTIFDELRRVRHQISGQLGHDPRNIVAYYAKLQSTVASRMIDLSGEAKTKKPDDTNKLQSNDD